jgi:hypothetical protein
LNHPFFLCVRFFQDRVSWTVCPGLTLNHNPPFSWVAGITCTSHQHQIPFVRFCCWLSPQCPWEKNFIGPNAARPGSCMEGPRWFQKWAEWPVI